MKNEIVMIQERYCSHEVSKLLREKGFDEPCRSYYIDNDNYRNCGVEINRRNLICEEVLRPTHQMVIDWLREVHKIFIEISISIDLNGNYHFSYTILDKECKYVRKGYTNFDWTYEDVVEEALKYCLTELI